MAISTNAGRRLMIGIRGKTLDSETHCHLENIRPGSVILFSRNIESVQQVKSLIREIKETVTPPPLIAIDQEGGLVVRFFKEVAIMPGNMALGAIRSCDLARRQGIITGRQLKDAGIDINLAPVVDVVTGYDNPGITIRSFGACPAAAGELGSSLVAAMQSEGVAAVAKHFPGKGAAVKDAHVDLPTVEASWRDLQDIHLAPFAACIKSGVQGVMSSHVIYSRLTGSDTLPATFSRDLVTGWLRQTADFQGVTFSDDLEMGAIARFFPFAEAVLKAAQAGHDMVLVCSDYEKQRIARDVLAEACEQDRTFAEEADISGRRIDTLAHFCSQHRSSDAQSSMPETAGILAAEIARKSVTVINASGLLPIPDNLRSIAAIIPDLKDIESREEGLEAGENNVVAGMLKKSFAGGRIAPLFLSLDTTESDVADVISRAAQSSIVVAFIFNARYSPSQRFLLDCLQQRGTPCIFVLMRNPFDLEYVKPETPAVITYGYRIVQLEAAVEVLAGRLAARGQLPFSMRPYGTC
ncbi:MAG TPA: beta-N-acetylhexosaminidase [Thermodesulfobacteriota bacterium]|nr:beta-N-acetylhexosaminidase [Deltaproteobacteria bacterium]HNU72940.1 beta-N-acetylhexosaminidase [Thermodesulfobacteriota bacterium]HOC37858.1 beta-N-acetylhexosaminidase [Thermodesulfobacteriota bacterium]